MNLADTKFRNIETSKEGVFKLKALKSKSDISREINYSTTERQIKNDIEYRNSELLSSGHVESLRRQCCAVVSEVGGWFYVQQIRVNWDIGVGFPLNCTSENHSHQAYNKFSTQRGSGKKYRRLETLQKFLIELKPYGGEWVIRIAGGKD